MKHIDELCIRYPVLSVCKNDIEKTAETLIESFENGGKLLVAGNGGSCADSDHISGELLKSFVKKRRPSVELLDSIRKINPETGDYLSDKLQGSLPVIALTNNTALMTASLNDVDGNVMFAQQVNGYGKEGDVFLGISTCGKLKGIADICIVVPEQETFKIQELHLPVYHALCLEIEEYFWRE